MEILRVFDILWYNKDKYNKADVIASKVNGDWKPYSSNELIEQSQWLALGLIALGLRKDVKVGIMSPNRPEWNITDFGIMRMGGIQVPLYPTLSETDLGFILRDAEIKILFVSDAELSSKIEKVIQQQSLLLDMYTFDEVPGQKNWTQVVHAGKQRDPEELKPFTDQVTPDDLVTLIYTSGTTGEPKGVMLSHANVVSNIKACVPLIPPDTHKALSFLPLSHIFERMIVYLFYYSGISVYYAENMDTIVANLKEISPNIFTTVPRLLEKVYDRIISRGKAQKGVKRSIFFWALALGQRYEAGVNMGTWYRFQLSLANKLVFIKWREALGGHINAIVSGGAALQPRLARVFNAAQIPILEGYGLTETSPVIAVNTLLDRGMRFGTVGKIIKDCQVKISLEGEILAKGPNIMKGYYKHEEITHAVIDSDGFFHTGDVGEIDKDGFLKITDRIKELFKTSGGKYVAPGVIENKFKESPFIEQMMVIGEGERFASALIVPAFEYLKSWCAIKSIPYTTPKQMVNHPLVKERYQKEVSTYNENFGHWEQIKKFELLPDEWSIDGGELTPKLSVKRKVVTLKYKAIIDRMYAFTENITA